jgi:hypothetical protein
MIIPSLEIEAIRSSLPKGVEQIHCTKSVPLADLPQNVRQRRALVFRILRRIDFAAFVHVRGVDW